MRKLLLCFIGILLLVIYSCGENKNDRIHSFNIEKLDIKIVTNKKYGGRFNLTLTPKTSINDTVNPKDYIEVETFAELFLYFDKQNTKEIFFMSHFGEVYEINSVNYNFHYMKTEEQQHEIINRYKESLNSDNPISRLSIDTRYYSIILDQDTIKKGNIFGD